MPSISADRPDWSREEITRFWQPGRKLLRTIRKYQSNNKDTFLGEIVGKYWALNHKFWSVVTGAEIDLNCQIGGGLLIPHPNGIVIHPEAVLGCNCLIFQQVTIGVAGGKGVAVIGGNVDVGAGAKILGSITVGDHVKIGANAVVLNNVDSNSTVVGIPAKYIL